MNAHGPDAIIDEVDQYLLAGKSDEAIEVLDCARRQEPTNIRILQRLGDLYRSLERPIAAIDAYQQAIIVAPDHGELWASKGDALIDLRDSEGAIAAFQQASRLAPSAFSEIDWNLRAERCYSYEDYETAGRLYEQSLGVRPNADAWRGLGLVALGSGRLDEAVKAYEKGLDLEPNDVYLLNDLGLAYREQSRLSEALDTFKRLVTLEPESAYAWFNLGLVSRESGEFQAAHDAYLKVLEITPEEADAWLELGICELNLGEGELWLRKALSSFERATVLDHDAYGAWTWAGWILGEVGEFDAAVERLDRAIELDEIEVWAWGTKVVVLADGGQISRAEACANAMLRVVDDRGEALRIKGLLLGDWKMNSTEQLNVLREASALKPGDVDIESDIAEALLKVGDYAESRGAARKMLKLELMEYQHCAMLFIVYAAYVLDGTSSPKRRSAFREFIAYYRYHFVTGARGPSTWNYRGLANMILQNGEVNEESAFLLAMAIDMQVGTINSRTASFFTGELGGPPQPAAQ
jgi:tetratricopeptide (TPR) repeat protein